MTTATPRGEFGGASRAPRVPLPEQGPNEACRRPGDPSCRRVVRVTFYLAVSSPFLGPSGWHLGFGGLQEGHERASRGLPDGPRPYHAQRPRAWQVVATPGPLAGLLGGSFGIAYSGLRRGLAKGQGRPNSPSRSRALRATGCRAIAGHSRGPPRGRSGLLTGFTFGFRRASRGAQSGPSTSLARGPCA